MVIDTLAGAAVGAIIGSLGTHFLQIRRQRNREKQEITNLRHSIIAELSCMDDLLRSSYDDNNDTFPVGMSIPSKIYESNSGRLSLLTQTETERVIRFYSGALKYQKMVEEKADIQLSDSGPPTEIYEEREAKTRIREEWVRSVVALVKESDKYPSAINFEGREIKPHEDIQFEDLWVFLNHSGISEKGMEAEPVND
jgi:hypothetical protein